MVRYTVGFIVLVGWMGLVCSYHLAPRRPPMPVVTRTTTPKPTTTTAPVEYEPPEIEGPITTTTTTQAPTTTTRRPTTHYGRGYSYGPHGYYDPYGRYQYSPYSDPYYNSGQYPYPYGGAQSPHGASQSPYGTAHPPYGSGPQGHVPYPSPAYPGGSQSPYAAQSPYSDPYSGQYPSDPYYGNPYNDQYYRSGTGGGSYSGGLKQSGHSALMDSLMITKPPHPTSAAGASSSPFRHSGKWIEMRGASDLRIKPPRGSGQANERRGYIPRGEPPVLKRKSPTASSSYYQDPYVGSKVSSGGSQANWNSQQQPNNRQTEQRGYQSGSMGLSGQNSWSNQSPWDYSQTWGYNQPASSNAFLSSAASNAVLPSAATYPPQALPQNSNTAAASSSTGSSQNNAFSAASSNVYPSMATAQTQNSNYYQDANTQGAYNYAGMSSSNNQAAGFDKSSSSSSTNAASYQQTMDAYNSKSGTSAGTNTAYNNQASNFYNFPGYNSQDASYRGGSTTGQRQAYNYDPTTYNTGTSIDLFGLGSLGNQGSSSNQLNSRTQMYNVDANAYQQQNSIFNNQMQDTWYNANTLSQAQSNNNANDISVSAMSPNNAYSVSSSNVDSATNSQKIAKTMINMLKKLTSVGGSNNAAPSSQSQTNSGISATDSNQNSLGGTPFKISKSMEAVIKTAIQNAARDLKNNMNSNSASGADLGYKTAYDASVSVTDTQSSAYDTNTGTTASSWQNAPTTTVQTWTDPAPTTAQSATASNAAGSAQTSQWNAPSWESSSQNSGSYFNYQTTTPSSAGSGAASNAYPLAASPNLSFLGALRRSGSSAGSMGTMTPRTTPNPLKGLQQLLLASVLFNKK